MKSNLIAILFIPLFFIACGKDSHEHDSESEHGHHVHVAPMADNWSKLENTEQVSTLNLSFILTAFCKFMSSMPMQKILCESRHIP